MKKAFYDKLEDIPQTDRDENNYELNQHSGSPLNGKYVLIIDQAHPVMTKNNELLQEKTTRDADKATAVNAAVSAKDTEIVRLTNELTTAKAQSVIPAGHVAVPADTLTSLTNFKALGEFDEVKKKVDEYGTMKEKDEANARKQLFSDIATAHGLDPDVFADLAEETKLHDRLEVRKTTDDKNVTTTNYFVKGKDEKNADTETAIGSFVNTDPKFKKFEKSLILSEEARKKLPIPNQKHGDPPSDKSAADSYITSTYERPDFGDK